MSKNIFRGIKDKETIMKTLKRFDRERSQDFEKRYKYAEKLIHCHSLDLDLAVINIEAHINSIKNLAAIFGLAIIIFSTWLSSPVIVEGYRFPVKLGATLFFASLSFCIFMWAEKETAWLHIIKIAVTQKSNPNYKTSSDSVESVNHHLGHPRGENCLIRKVRILYRRALRLLGL